MNEKVLFVDDDENLLASVHRNFKKRYDLDIAAGGPQALRAMEEHGPYAVVVADMAMPGMNGIEFLKKAQVLAPDTIRIMFTGHPGPVTLLEAINSGQVFRFIPKPCDLEEIGRAVDAGIRQHHLIAGERDLLEATLTRGIEAMIGILEVLDPVVYLSAQTLAHRSAQVARALGAADDWSITLAALYSPLWQLSLTPQERLAWASGTRDPGPGPDPLGSAIARAANLLQPIPRLEGVAQIVRYQGKNLDGTGFPGDPVRGEAIPLGARILRALQDFNAIEQKVKSRPVAWEELRMQRGRYDPVVLAALGEAMESF
ncbi:HD domain-containing phosphohydrolase [Mesoterricola silvestris]|uniref:Response regulator receiver modulated metal-depenent phosphohydrolase n=1 Tax=Mesoterricola silvestris TaxID=2927979 RepID=A0AA48K9G8_9BACT|nr:HD domain-containing phosphohydrolase [Mesoterricola silvestris]BDU73461.1 response regulator receiver modulated metal-depenent phosphohydrolase [Mesoterricola silvestris]